MPQYTVNKQQYYVHPFLTLTVSSSAVSLSSKRNMEDFIKVASPSMAERTFWHWHCLISCSTSETSIVMTGLSSSIPAKGSESSESGVWSVDCVWLFVVWLSVVLEGGGDRGLGAFPRSRVNSSFFFDFFVGCFGSFSCSL